MPFSGVGAWGGVFFSGTCVNEDLPGIRSDMCLLDSSTGSVVAYASRSLSPRALLGVCGAGNGGAWELEWGCGAVCARNCESGGVSALEWAPCGAV